MSYTPDAPATRSQPDTHIPRAGDAACRLGRNLRPRSHRTIGTACLVLMMFLLISSGCTSTIRVTDPDRTATEQFLLSKAAASAVEQLTVDGLRGRKVYLDSEFWFIREYRGG